MHHKVSCRLSRLLILLCFASNIFGQPGKIDVPVAGIFESGSESESAFSFAVFRYNKNPKNPFRLLSNIAIISSRDASVVLEKFCKLVTDGVFAVFTGDLATIPIVADTAAAIEVPLISTTNLGIPTPYMHSLVPSTTKALADILVKENWTSFSYLTNSDLGLDKLQTLIAELHTRSANLTLDDVTTHVMAEGIDALNALVSLETRLKKLTDKRLIINSFGEGKTEELMKLFSQLGMNRREYSFLFSSLNVADTDESDYIYSGVNLAGYQMLDPEVGPLCHNWSILQQNVDRFW